MNDIEDQLRELLEARTLAVTPDLSGARIRRIAQARAKRRSKVYAPLAAAAVVLAVAATPVLLHHRQAAPSPQPAGTPGITAPLTPPPLTSPTPKPSAPSQPHRVVDPTNRSIPPSAPSTPGDTSGPSQSSTDTIELPPLPPASASDATLVPARPSRVPGR